MQLSQNQIANAHGVHGVATAKIPANGTGSSYLRDAFPWDTAPRYLPRDRGRIFGDDFRKQVKAMGIQEVLAAPRSPWQRACVERVIGTIRRECLDHVMVFNQAARHVKSFVAYYHECRTHLSLDKDTPEPRPVQPPEIGRVIAIPQVGGLHHRYERRAA
jgi:transposase InsO family protein